MEKNTDIGNGIPQKKMITDYKEVFEIVEKTTKLIKNNGGGTTIAAVGLVIILISWISYMFPSWFSSPEKYDMSTTRYITSMTSGVILAIVGVILRLYAQIKAQQIETERIKLYSTERISQFKISEEQDTARNKERLAERERGKLVLSSERDKNTQVEVTD